MAINRRLQKLLDQERASYAVLPHDEAFTAPEVARSMHVEERQLAKVVVMHDEVGDLMVVLPAGEHLDTAALRRATGRPGLRLEEEYQLRRLFPDCELGAMPPFGALYGMPMVVDPCVLEGEDVYFQAGNHHEVVLMRRGEYERIARSHRAGACLHGALGAARA